MYTNENLAPIPSGSSATNVGSVERMISAAVGAFFVVNGLTGAKGFLNSTTRLGIGGYLLYRGLSGNCPMYTALGRETVGAAKALDIHTSLTVNRPRHEVYEFWRRLENLPRFMEHLITVKQLNERESEWEARAPKGLATVRWRAFIVDDIPGELLSWQSEPGSAVDNAGSVVFTDAPGGQGTELRVTINYTPPAGDIGRNVAKVFNPAFRQMVKKDLMQFKQYIETGEIATIQGQPSGRNETVNY